MIKHIIAEMLVIILKKDISDQAHLLDFSIINLINSTEQETQKTQRMMKR